MVSDGLSVRRTSLGGLSNGGARPFSDAFAPAIVWKTLWPVLVGVGLFMGLRHWRPRPPAFQAAIVALGAGLSRAIPTCGAVIAKLDGILRFWTAACLMLLLIVLLLVLAMGAGG